MDEYPVFVFRTIEENHMGKVLCHDAQICMHSLSFIFPELFAQSALQMDSVKQGIGNETSDIDNAINLCASTLLYESIMSCSFVDLISTLI